MASTEQAIQRAVEEAALAAVARRNDARNVHDIDAFLAAHAEDVAIYGYPTSRIGAGGRAHLARIFTPLFTEGLGSAVVHDQWAYDRFVVSNETIVEEGEANHIIYIYEVEDGEISALRLISDPQEDAAGGVANVSAAERSALSAVARSIDGFNAHDLDAYLAAFAEDVGVYVFPDLQRGAERAHLERIFGPSFERGEGAIEVRGQWVTGNVVVTDEVMSGGGASERIIVIHTVEDGVISEYRLIEE